MKKILIGLLFVFSLGVICIAPKVEAANYNYTNYKAVDYYGNQILNSESEGLFLDAFSFFSLDETDKEKLFYDYTYMDNFIESISNDDEASANFYFEIMASRLGYKYNVEEFESKTAISKWYSFVDYMNIFDNIPFIYIFDLEFFNHVLFSYGYINENETWEDFSSVNGKLGNAANVLEYILEEGYGVLVDKPNVPNFIYSSNVSDFDEVIENVGVYTIDYTYNWYVQNDYFSFLNPTDYGTNNGEISKIKLQDSVGYFVQKSNSSFLYIYWFLSSNELVSDYIVSNEEISIEIDIKNMPDIAFDSNGNLKSNYFSIKNNVWYPVDIKQSNKSLQFNWTYLRKAATLDILNDNEYYYYEVYFDFDLPIDCLFEIKFNLPIKCVKTNIFGSVKDERVMSEYNFVMTAKHGTTLRNPGYGNLDSWYKLFHEDEIVENYINKGSYLIDNKSYDYKIFYRDDTYAEIGRHPNYSDNNISSQSYRVYDWAQYRANYFNYYPNATEKDYENALSQHPVSYFFENLYPFSNEDNLMTAEAVYLYDEVIYSSSGIGNFVPPKDHPNPKEEKSLWEIVKEFFLKLWNFEIFKFPIGKILICSTLGIIIIPIIVKLFILLFKKKG